MSETYVALLSRLFSSEKKTICESAAHPSGYRGTQLWFGFVVSTQQQKINVLLSLINVYILIHEIHFII